MAPTAQAPAKRATYDGSRPRFDSLESWLNIYGSAEYAIYKRDAAPDALSYDDWSASEHVLGPFLWYTTLDVWEEDSTTDEESDLEAPKFIARGSPERQPKKPATANGHGVRRGGKSSKPTQRSKPEAAVAAKRRRKSKKTILSEDIVVSEVSDEIEAKDETVPATPASPVHGRRKSGGRKKKQFLSAEIVLTEDEEEGPVSFNGVAEGAAHAREPSAPIEHHTPVAKATSEPLKGNSAKKPRNKPSSQAIIPLGDDERAHTPADGAVTPKNAAASPEGPGSSSSRRALRIRTPAQQRPYFHHAQVFDELVSEPEAEPSMKFSPPKAKLTKLAQVSYPVEVEAEVVEEEATLLPPEIDDEDDDDDDGILDPEPEERHQSRKAHYKGKGRAWKKTSEDEDEDYKSPAKIRAPKQPKRNVGRRKSAQVAQGQTRDEEHGDVKEAKLRDGRDQDDSSILGSAQKAGKQKRRTRRINHLSEEFVRDDSDTATEEQQRQQRQQQEQAGNEAEDFSAATRLQKTPTTTTSRSRKSDQSVTSKGTMDLDTDEESHSHHTPGEKKSTTPKAKTPKMKAPILSLVQAPEEEPEKAGTSDALSPFKNARKRKSQAGSDAGES